MVWYSHLFKSFPQFMIHTVKVFGVVNETEVDVFFWNCLAFSMIQKMMAIWLLDPLPLLSPSLDIWKFSFHIMLKPSMQDFKHNLTTVEDECNCLVVWIFFGNVLLRNWDEDWHFPHFYDLWPLLGFPNLLTYWVQNLASSVRISNSSAGIPSFLPALLTALLPKAHLTSHSRISGFWVSEYHIIMVI